MNKTIINVPKGVEYLSEWDDFKLLDYPYILNKQITGCGFTEFCLSCNANIILCSPRRILLENKSDSYNKKLAKLEPGVVLPYKLYYAKNQFEKLLNYDKDLTATKKIGERVTGESEESKNYTSEFKSKIKDFYYSCDGISYCKILVTYDSFRKVREALDELGVFDKFYVVIDEFQSIFTDSRFKPSTEIEFLNTLQTYPKVCYASATPMIEEYLDQMDEFKDLPYYELNWEAEDPTRVTTPKIKSTSCARLLRKVYEIVDKYRNDSFRDSDNNVKRFVNSDGAIEEIKSKEAVFYMNSVKNICSIIKNCKLTQNECNILCANTSENVEKIRKAFGVSKSEFLGLGKVYTEDEMDKNKMFTFCTRTVYLGADFYSTNARSFIFSDANSKTMAVDITLDLPQILGRQRYELNPWKNEAEIYYLTTKDSNKQSSEDFKEYLDKKCKATNNLISAYRTAEKDDVRITLSDTYERFAVTFNYEDNFVSVNRHDGKLPVPVLNKLVMLSEIREYQIRQIDYADRFSIRASINSKFGISSENQYVNDIIDEFNSKRFFQDKMKFLCDILETITEEIRNEVLYRIDDYYSNYFIEEIS
jgi:hypothetical protein